MTGPPTERTLVDEQGERVWITPRVREYLDSLFEMYRTLPNEQRSLGLPPKKRSNRHAWLTRLVEDGRNFLGLIDDVVVGHVAYTPVSASKPDLVVFVNPDYQRRGIGTALVSHAFERATAEHIDGFVSYVERDNESAISLYRKLGFEELSLDRTTIKMGVELDSETVDDATEYIEQRTED